jgi:hypothetical protein
MLRLLVVGFRRIGFNPILSLLAAPALHTLAIFTSPYFPFFNPLLPLHLKYVKRHTCQPGLTPGMKLCTVMRIVTCLLLCRNIHRTKHGSDSGVYDHEGRYVPSKFERIMTFDRDNKVRGENATMGGGGEWHVSNKHGQEQLPARQHNMNEHGWAPNPCCRTCAALICLNCRVA